MPDKLENAKAAENEPVKELWTSFSQRLITRSAGSWLFILALAVAGGTIAFALAHSSGTPTASPQLPQRAVAKAAPPTPQPLGSDSPTPIPPQESRHKSQKKTLSLSPTTASPASPAASPSCYWNCPDGKPGWAGEYGGCAQAAVPSSTSPNESLTLHLIIPRSTYAAGEFIEAELEVRNTGLSSFEFRTYSTGDDGTLVDEDGKERSGARYSDAVSSHTWNLGPGESSRQTVTIRTTQCGDTSGPEPELPAGRYQVVGWLNLYQSDTRHWVSPSEAITLT